MYGQRLSGAGRHVAGRLGEPLCGREVTALRVHHREPARADEPLARQPRSLGGGEGIAQQFPGGIQVAEVERTGAQCGERDRRRRVGRVRAGRPAEHTRLGQHLAGLGPCPGRVVFDLSLRQAEGGRDQPGAVTTLGGQTPGPALGEVELLGRGGGVPSVEGQRRVGERDLGAVVVHRGRNAQCRHGVVAGGGQLRPMPDQHLHRVLRITAAERVPQGFPGHVVRGEPAGGPAMQVRDGLRAAPVQLPAQHVAEESRGSGTSSVAPPP